MKKSFFALLLIILSPVVSFCQTGKDVTSVIKDITIYTREAQIEREATVQLQQGQMVLNFTGLSPYIRKESIRIEGDGSFIIQNVQHQNNYLNRLEKNRELESLSNKIDEIQGKIELEKTWVKILNEKLDFLNTNKLITGKDQSVSPDAFNSLNTIYGSNLETLTLEILKRERVLKEYDKEISKLNSQIISLNNKSDLPSGTIIVSIDAKQARNAKVKLSYLVDNATWYPTYDIRFTGSDKPLTVTFKANINQNTGIDWSDVNITLSTAKTNISAQIPALEPNYLQYYYPSYDARGDVTSALQGRVAGVEISEAPSMRIRGVASVKPGENPLYVVDGVPYDDISHLDADEIESVSVLKDASATAIYGSRGSNGVVMVTTKKDKDNSSIPMTITSKREISNEYTITTPQSINSNSKTSTIIFKEIRLNSTYEYQTVPLLSENVFLIGRVADWYKSDLMDGEANIYLENSYVGKSRINTQQFTDTLELSFGVDNNISVKREKLTDFSQSQLIGMNRKVTVAWKITVRNNKSYPVTAKVTDQVPVTTTKEIQVETIELSGGKLNEDTGKVEWSLDLKGGEVKELILRYSVKYPKDKNVIIDR